MKCNLNPTNYINTTAPEMWNVAGTHTCTKPMAHNFTHTGKLIRAQRRKGESWGKNQMILRKIYICYKVWCGMVCCMMWNVWGLDGPQSVKWCRIAHGVKWWREMSVWCGMSWCDFSCFVVWIYKFMCSVQSSLRFLYYVVFSVMSVQYCLCVSRIQCTQCSVSG